MSSPFKWPKRARSHSSTSSTDSNSVVSLIDKQLDLSDDEASAFSNQSESECSQPPSQHSSPLLVAEDSQSVDSDNEEANTRARAQDTKITAGDERAIMEIIGILTRRKWSFADFLCMYMRSGERPGRRVHGFQKALKDPKVCELAGLAPDDVVPDGAKLLPRLRKEFKCLTEKPGFDVYDPTAPADKLLPASTSLKSIKKFTPIWYHLLSNLLTPAHSRKPGRKRQRTRSLQRKLLAITAIVCHTRSPRKSSYFQQSVGVHLLSSGVKKRVVHVLHGMGISASYQLSNKAYSKVAEAQKAVNLRIAKLPQTVIAYDNFNFLDRVRDQVLGSSKPVMRNLTTAVLVCHPEIPATGLQQSMLQTNHELRLSDFIHSPGLRRGLPDDMQFTRYIIADAIRKLHPDQILNIMDSKEYEERFSPPEMKRLKSGKHTSLHPLGVIFDNEGTIEGNISLHKDIWIEKLGFSECDEDRHFAERLWLVYGDQLTSQMIRTTRNLNGTAKRAFDRRKWMLGPPALFHIQQALLFLIIRTHFDSSGCDTKASPSTLLFDITTLQRSGLSRDSAKIHLFEPLLIHGFSARVLAIFLDYLEDMNESDDLHPTYNNFEECDRALGNLDGSTLDCLVEKVRKKVFTVDAWRGDNEEDREFVSMCRYLQQVETYFMLRYAIRAGDIGMLRWLVDPLCIMFIGSEQWKYADELLHLRWLLKDETSSLELQEAILSGGLVEQKTDRDRKKPIDLAVEHVNLCYHLDMKTFKNSTHDFNTTINRVGLTAPYTDKLRSRFERDFGHRNSRSHSYKSAVHDIYLLAARLREKGRTAPRNNLKKKVKQFESPDILTDGLDRLSEKIDNFNVKFVDLPGHLHGIEDDGVINPNTEGVAECSVIDDVLLCGVGDRDFDIAAFDI